MLDREGLHLGPLVPHRFAGIDFDQVDAVVGAADEAAERLEEVAQAARSVDRQRLLPRGQVIGLKQARQAEDVVRVEMGQVDLVDLREPQRALQLSLRPFAAVEHHPLPTAGEHHARRRASRRRHGAARAEKGRR